MSTVTQKYLRDENGEIISPITSAKSVMIDRGDFASTVEEIIPYTYRIDCTSKFFTEMPIFNGTISKWTMIKLNLKVWTTNLVTNKNIELRLNDADITGGYVIDARRREGNWESYNPVSEKKTLFLGDIPFQGETSFLELTLINGQSSTEKGWFPFKSVLSSVAATKDQYSLSVASGQFEHPNLGSSLTSIALIVNQGIKALGMIQIYT